jgi:hypothetical protein
MFQHSSSFSQYPVFKSHIWLEFFRSPDYPVSRSSDLAPSPSPLPPGFHPISPRLTQFTQESAEGRNSHKAQNATESPLRIIPVTSPNCLVVLLFFAILTSYDHGNQEEKPESLILWTALIPTVSSSRPAAYLHLIALERLWPSAKVDIRSLTIGLGTSPFP